MCQIKDCNKKIKSRNLCSKHYQIILLTGERVRKRKTKGRTCSLGSCNKPHKGLGYCNGHYNRLKIDGNVNESKPLEPSYEPKKNSNGYMVYKKNNKTIKVHREVMEKYLNRELLPHESVHHKNGNRADNRIENLELWSTSQPYGQRVEDKVKWALEILETYTLYVQSKETTINERI